MGIPCLLCVIVINRKDPVSLFFYTWRFFFSKGVEQIITYLPMEVFDPAAVYFEASSRQPTTIRWLLISCVLPFPKSSFVAPVLNDQVTFDFPQCHHFQNSQTQWWFLSTLVDGYCYILRHEYSITPSSPTTLESEIFTSEDRQYFICCLLWLKNTYKYQVCFLQPKLRCHPCRRILLRSNMYWYVWEGVKKKWGGRRGFACH